MAGVSNGHACLGAMCLRAQPIHRVHVVHHHQRLNGERCTRAHKILCNNNLIQNLVHGSSMAE